MFKYVKKGDILLSFVLLISSMVLVGILFSQSSGGGVKYASIQVEGVEVRRLDFINSNIGQRVRIDTPYGYNVFEIGEGSIRSIESDCKEKIHIKQGWISSPGQTLVCLPHKLVVEIKTEDNMHKNEIDHVNF